MRPRSDYRQVSRSGFPSKGTRTKTKQLRYRERNRQERIKYYRTLRKLIKIYGGKSLVFIDESGFEGIVTKIYAWSKRGQKIYGERQGKRGIRENLVQQGANN